MNDILNLMLTMADSTDGFIDPGWMTEFFGDIITKNQYLVTIDDECEVSSLLCYWKFGSKRWGYIRKCQYTENCPKQMGKGKHLYVPFFYIREDRRGTITVKRFLDMLKRECPDATTLSWHDESGRFVTYKLIRRQDNGSIQKERSTADAEC